MLEDKKNFNMFKIISDEFVNNHIKQANKGLEKYNQYIKPLDNYDWNNMALEELTDAFSYIVTNKIKTIIIINTVNNILNQTIKDIELLEKIRDVDNPILDQRDISQAINEQLKNCVKELKQLIEGKV